VWGHAAGQKLYPQAGAGLVMPSLKLPIWAGKRGVLESAKWLLSGLALPAAMCAASGRITSPYKADERSKLAQRVFERK
jgi:hypothetical protein